MLSGQPKFINQITSFSMEHSFVSGAYSESVYIVGWVLSQIIQLNEIGITKHIALIFFLGLKG